MMGVYLPLLRNNSGVVWLALSFKALMTEMQNINIYFDGGSKPQRVNGWYGLHFKMEREQFGPMTCNQAEYTALIKALEWVFPKIPAGVKPVINIFTDSMLVREQVTGNYRVKKAHLKNLCDRAKELLKQSDRWNIQWRSRTHNVNRFGH